MGELLMVYAAWSLATGGAVASGGGWWPTMPLSDSETFWKIIGFSGIAVFSTRFLFQWLYSEKHKECRIPLAFWYQSMAGTILLMFYFTRQQDLVGVSGYVFNIVPYTRNIMLMHGQRKRQAQKAQVCEVAVSDSKES